MDVASNSFREERSNGLTPRIQTDDTCDSSIGTLLGPALLAVMSGTSAACVPVSDRPVARYFLPVRLAGAFLAEAAATVDQKLNVQGGVLSKFTVGPDRFARFVLVVLTQPDTNGSADRRVDVEIRPPTPDAPVYKWFDAPEAAVGEFPGFAFFEIEARLPADGRWAVEVSCSGTGVSLPLVVSGWTPPALDI